jgi:predicted SAM-dependent methyltransferase
MLNWAARYFPILRALKPQLADTDSLLEIGSGSIGIGKFRRVPFVGCDVNFSFRPKAPMLPLVASATNLPFDDGSFDAVVASDVLEHVFPEQRIFVIREALRVARKIAIFGFPSGPQAFEYDLKLAEAYDRSRRDRPAWLEEHVQYQPFPTEDLFEELQHEWTVSSFDNENVVFHNWVMRQEMHRPGIYCFRILLAVLPRLMEYALRRADREPYYRKIVVVQRRK